MDFLKNAVASAIATGPPFPYNFGDKVDIDESVFTLYNGTKRRTIKFINTDASSIHGNLKVGSVYTSESGEWKLGGFEVLSSVKDDESAIYTYGSLVPDSSRYAPPELAQGGWDVIKKNPHSAVDSFSFGVLIFETFNNEYNGSSQAGQTKNIPPTMQSSYKRLCNANPKARIAVSAFLEQGNRTGSFFDSPLIKLTDGIDNLGMKSPSEREEFLSDLDQLTDDFPEEFFKMKVLPELIKSVEFGGGGPKALGVILKIAANMSNDDFETRITPFIIKMFANPDRAIRVYLLDNLPLIIDRLPQKIVNDKLFPHIVTGFTDVQPVVREQTLKSVLLLISKLSDRTINGDLLKHLAKTANDEQPGIRTNTTICLGKIAKHLGTSSRSKVLIAAFTRSLRDPFVHARNAALMSLAATAEYFTEEDCAVRILPLVCPLMIDKERMIRDQANRTIDSYLQKVRKAASAMPDTALPPPKAGETQPARMGTPQQSGSAGWTGWAISSFTNKLSTAAGDMQTANGGSGVNSPKPTSSPGPETRRLPSTSASTRHKQAISPPPPQTYGTTSPSASAMADAFWQDDGFDDAGDAWGEMGDDDEVIPSSTTSKAPEKAVPFDDGEEPDFAGWLAAQAQKKKPGSAKPLPKGLSKSTTTKKPAAKPTAKPAAKVPAAKKIDMKPKETDDDDGWGDGW
ncbi:protein kinase-like protein [Metarhizium acridum CQMa 102]|uniref:Protein kinase-like protein n=2 Tax=Metarhizium acridum TaxID=92637 RepID=E9DRH0_METAQ|nr:protein kinase-like protein [Metarhizium acridum CQMa 102]EFY93848.1 protein kinase-like protein [Metarhizium acridum CQMa 102]